MYIILPDLHSPAYNRAFVQAVLKYIYLNRQYITGIVFSGDTLDNTAISRFSIGQLSDITLGEEYDICNKLLDMFDEALGPNKETTFMFGNHEDRFRKKIHELEASKLGSAIMDVEFGLKLVERKYRIFNDYQNDIYQIDDMSIIHGLYCSIHAAKKHCEVFKTNIMFGHTHRVQMFDEGKYTGYNIGFMGDKNHPYFNYTTVGAKSYWVNSFARISSYCGVTSTDIVKWHGDHFILDGKVYK